MARFSSGCLSHRATELISPFPLLCEYLSNSRTVTSPLQKEWRVPQPKEGWKLRCSSLNIAHWPPYVFPCSLRWQLWTWLRVVLSSPGGAGRSGAGCATCQGKLTPVGCVMSGKPARRRPAPFRGAVGLRTGFKRHWGTQRRDIQRDGGPARRGLPRSPDLWLTEGK